MGTKKIVPGRSLGSEDILDVDSLPEGDDFDYAHIGVDNPEGTFSKFTVAGLVLLVAAGIGGGMFVSSRLPGVGTDVTSQAPVHVAVATPELTAPPVVHISIPQNIPRPPDASSEIQNPWQDFLAIEPAAGTPSGPPSEGTATTTTTTTTTANSQQVTEVPVQPPAMPSGAQTVAAPASAPATATTTTTTTTSSTATDVASTGNTAAAPALTAPDENLPAIGGAAASAATAGSEMGTGAVSGTAAAPVSPTPETAKPSGPDAYYDSAAPPPPGMANVVGPRQLNAEKEPGSKFIIVEKNTGPQSTDSRIAMADRALALGHYEAAVDMFEALYKKNPRDPRILMGRAVAFQKTGRTEAALKTYDKLLTIDRNNPEALVNMLGILRTEYPEVALRRLKNLHEKYPANPMIAAQIGVTEADGGHLADAVRFLGMAVSMEPNNAQHLFNMAIVQDRAGKKNEAVKYYQQALEVDAVYGESRSVPREQIYDRLSVLRQQ